MPSIDKKKVGFVYVDQYSKYENLATVYEMVNTPFGITPILSINSDNFGHKRTQSTINDAAWQH